jgi:hypothetical protein
LRPRGARGASEPSTLAPLIHRVAAVLCVVAGIHGGSPPIARRERLSPQVARDATMDESVGAMPHRAWADFARELTRRSVVGGAVATPALKWCNSRWVCGRHASTESGSEVRAHFRFMEGSFPLHVVTSLSVRHCVHFAHVRSTTGILGLTSPTSLATITTQHHIRLRAPLALAPLPSAVWTRLIFVRHC